MDKFVSIIMYHYVRDLKHSRFPELKALSAQEFKDQIGYFKKYYNIISAHDLMESIQFDVNLPPRALLLTFDDGYIDHFTQVFPILNREKIPACFFPAAKCIMDNRMLDVNKIHFILASIENKGIIVEHICRSLDLFRSSYDLESNDNYWHTCAKKPNRFDSAEVVFIKRMLQNELPEQLRKTIIDDLFKKYVTRDEKAFSKELYMSFDQVACLQRNGMYIGSHSFDHNRLNYLMKNEQEREIDLSLEFLQNVGSDTSRWIMSYPYGAFNESLLKILEQRNCIIGLTIQVEIADLRRDDPLKLPRLDTNHLPKNSNVSPNKWTQKVINEHFGA